MKQGNRQICAIIGIALIVFGMVVAGNTVFPHAGVFLLIVGVLFLCFSKVPAGKKQTSGNLPSAAKLRAMQSAAESRLLSQAKAADEKDQPVRETVSAYGKETASFGSTDEMHEYKEELKSLYEGGILSAEEYADRLKNLVKN